jgi:Zn-dependent protease with chaperone function
MALTQLRFDNLVKQLERDAAERPREFRRRVLLMVVLGYSYILLILSLLILAIFYIPTLDLVSIPYGAVWMGCALVICLILLGILTRSLWVNIPKPQGKRLRRREAPELFDFIDELSISLKAPKFQNILLIDELNVAVLQRPRLGIFGWFQNYLLIGLPLMEAMTVEQFRAVIAHELGHLSGKHSRFAGWIYRIHQAWVQLLTNLHEQHQRAKAGSGIWYVDTVMLITNGVGFLLFGWFFDWFVTSFNAHSFVLSRTNEYEADRCAANWVGEIYIAEALISINIKKRYLHRSFWPEIYRQADRNQELPHAISLMFQGLKANIPDELKERWLNASMAEKTDYIDTHPCLSERLQALGYDTDFRSMLDNLTIDRSAADKLFNQDMLDNLTLQANEKWQKESRKFWQGRSMLIQDITPKLIELTENSQARTLTIEEKWDICRWTAEINGRESAIPLLQSLLAERSYHAPANLLLGKILLEKQDDTGIAYIESAVSCDPEHTVPGYQLVCDFLYYDRGDTDRLKYYQEAIQQFYYKYVCY